MSIEDELLPHNVTRMWSRFEAAMQERDMQLQSETIRFFKFLKFPVFFISVIPCLYHSASSKLDKLVITLTEVY